MSPVVRRNPMWSRRALPSGKYKQTRKGAARRPVAPVPSKTSTAAREPTEAERLASGPRVSGGGMPPPTPAEGLDLSGVQGKLSNIKALVSAGQATAPLRDPGVIKGVAIGGGVLAGIGGVLAA
ncbi:unnamed protein product, partial [marine sediment metagenome]